MRHTEAWRRIASAFRSLVQTLSNPDHAPSEETAQRLRADIDEIEALVGRLAKEGAMSPWDAELLLVELDILRDELSLYLPGPEPSYDTTVLCYEQVEVTLPPSTAERLELRLAVLERLAEKESVAPEVVELVRDRIETDLAAAHPLPSPLSLDPELARLADETQRLGAQASGMDQEMVRRVQRLWETVLARTEPSQRVPDDDLA